MGFATQRQDKKAAPYAANIFLIYFDSVYFLPEGLPLLKDGVKPFVSIRSSL
ncbi:hypothetical protein DU19_0219 [Chlamydia muridarum]|nr:hypothetical protein TAC_01020 [Chlamydia muridarum str. Nigg3 CMUT3-5]AHH23509.1 hypothetical protein Y015_01020 [Chlamydia muridarum str. Nigg CM972]KDU80500.1 hypothetical protein DU17_0219 [Chlamydia muridarum]KDU81190.1 hypothetical protein DU18_0220 [Chlamydia muridarum]KDU82758.1 hypothetical protein DU19_0219 [Chlamydia muridarum]